MSSFWGPSNRDRWPDLDEREVSNGGAGMHVAGFVLADRFDTILREISPDYLQAAWKQLDAGLTRQQLVIPDLAWGYLHSGLTDIPGIESHAPSDFTGWSSQKLAYWTHRHWTTIYEDSQLGSLDDELGHGHPALRLAQTSESHQWRIAPGDGTLAIRLVEALWTDETSDWAPEWLLKEQVPNGEPWLEIAQAIQDDDQCRLDWAAKIARQQYTPFGYRIMAHGYGQYLDQWQSALRLEPPA
jgi:hypothetical protein